MLTSTLVSALEHPLIELVTERGNIVSTHVRLLIKHSHLLQVVALARYEMWLMISRHLFYLCHSIGLDHIDPFPVGVSNAHPFDVLRR